MIQIQNDFYLNKDLHSTQLLVLNYLKSLQQPVEPNKIEDIATNVGVSETHCRRILGTLHRKGLIKKTYLHFKKVRLEVLV